MGVKCVQRVFAGASTGVVLTLLLGAGAWPLPVDAATVPAPAWSVWTAARPTSFRPSESFDEYEVWLTNVGGASSNGQVSLTDALPTGITTSAQAGDAAPGEGGEWECTPGAGASVVTCTLPGPVAALGQAPTLVVPVTVGEDASSPLVNEVRVSGGGAPEAAVSSQAPLGASPPFGLNVFASEVLGLDGTPALQAGAHPNALVLNAGLNTVVRETPEGKIGPTSVRDVRDVVLDLPVGLVGSALAAPTCTLAQLSAKGETGEPGASGCPADSVVGHIRTEPRGGAGLDGALYNVVPERGIAVEFGYVDANGGSHVLYGRLAPSPAGYLLRLTAREIPQIPLTGLSVAIYGDPAVRDGSSLPAVPMFTIPEDCSGRPLQTSIHMDSWQAPGSYGADGSPDFADPNWALAGFESPPVAGCSALAGLFGPAISVVPSTTAADTPTGLDVNVEIPQQEGVESLATPPLRAAVVTLPAGLSIDPAVANGLQPCSLAQLGMSPAGVPDAAAPQCPNASKIGTVEMESPALPVEACREAKPLRECPAASERERTPLHGGLYLATPYDNPFASLFAIYIAIDDPRTGVILKLPAEVNADPLSGRLTIALEDAPQFPLSDLRLHFFAGSTALLATPATCGAHTVSSELTPWSAPESGSPATPSSSFAVTQAADGGACTSPLRFAPSFAAGTTSAQAGAYTPFSLTVLRRDSEQTLGGFTVTLPPGLLANLTSVAPCPEPQAARGECGPQSLLGQATAAIGAGPQPYWLREGRVYLTGPYDGGPFGLTIVLPTTAGPFTLRGNGGPGLEILRGSIRIDPRTAQMTILSDSLPTILQGVPLEIKTLNLTINRPGFTRNPSNCNPLAATGTIASTAGVNASVSSPFYAAGCRKLAFSPRLTALTYGNGEFTGHGASLHVKLTAADGQANLHSLKLDLPRRLPARLESIQQACREATFARDPASCPKASVIGSATVATPLLGHALRGPAILVSHGGKAFPDMVLVLQAEGVRIDLRGALFVDSHNVTSTTFASIPDVPIRRLDLVLPEGSGSALVASGGLCTKRPLRMATAMTGQNGAHVKQTVKVAVAGCRHKHRKRHSGRSPKRTKKHRSTRR